MKKFSIFLMVEGFLIFLALITLLKNRSFTIFLIIAFLLIAASVWQRKKVSVILLSIVALFLVLNLVTNFFVWLAVLIGCFYLANEKREKLLKEKRFFVIRTTENDEEVDNKEVPWFGNIDIGKETFEWDDINIIQIAGDSIIDLGNTILPKGDNIILIRKLLGKTRLIIPGDIALKIEYATLIGNLKLNEEVIPITNGTVTRFDLNYRESTRHLKVYINMIAGDVEVIRT
ncbi:MAG: cell wall-active antibiotics response protein LiaF [Streptococcaceae bacterium]|nr:cell wall-active antibiotics response protein LiaF [Streptococcaceae bacterium]